MLGQVFYKNKRFWIIMSWISKKVNTSYFLVLAFDVLFFDRFLFYDLNINFNSRNVIAENINVSLKISHTKSLKYVEIYLTKWQRTKAADTNNGSFKRSRYPRSNNLITLPRNPGPKPVR